ncbi:MAG: DUF2852 domain-containing protein [Devosia sp.]
MSTAIIKPQWSPLTIALMVIGFIVWWPVGLAVLGYILWGEYMGGSAEKAQRFVDKQKAFVGKYANRQASAPNWQGHAGEHSGNAAFDEYRAEQLRKLEEERRRLDEEIAAFHEYNASLNKQKDREAFERFMAERRGSRQGFDTKPPEDRRY